MVNHLLRRRVCQKREVLTACFFVVGCNPFFLVCRDWAQVDLLIAEQQLDSVLLSVCRIEVFSLHAQDALVPLRGDLHVRDVRYEIIKGELTLMGII
jgi:hypothetical protein